MGRTLPSAKICAEQYCDHDTVWPSVKAVWSLRVEQSSTREWARYTAVTVRLVQPAQRGRSFRWRGYSEGQPELPFNG